jgi:hypothetical protein
MNVGLELAANGRAHTLTAGDDHVTLLSPVSFANSES